MQAAHRVVKNTGILYAKIGITVFISLYATRLILQALGVQDFGLFNVVGGAVAMMGFLNASMTLATQRFMSYAQGAGDDGKLNQIFNVSLVLHLLIAALLLIILEVFGYFFFKKILNISSDKIQIAKLIYQFMIVSTLFTVISVPYDAIINARENMLLFAILGIIEAAFKLLIAFYITYILADRLLVYGLLMASLSVFLLLIRVYYCQKKYKESKISIKANYDKKLMREMTGFAGWSLLSSSTSMVSNYGQGIVLNIFFGTAVNAAQGIANQVSGQLGVFAVTMLKALNPMIDKSEGAGQRDLMLKTSILGSKVSFFLLVILYVPVLIETPFIFKLWLKDVPGYCIIFCRLLLLRYLIEQLFLTLNASIIAVGNIKIFQLSNAVLNFFPLIVTYFLFTFHYPAYYLYVVFIIYSAIALVQTLYFASKYCGLSITYFVKNVVVKCVLIFTFILATSSLPILLMPQGYARLFSVFSISSISFLITVWLFGFSAEERNWILHLAKSATKKINLKSSIFYKPFLKI